MKVLEESSHEELGCLDQTQVVHQIALLAGDDQDGAPTPSSMHRNPPPPTPSERD